MKSSEKAHSEIKKLNKRLKRPSLRFKKSGKYCFVYKTNYTYDPEKRHSVEKLGESIGKIPLERFERDEKAIRLMTVEELKEIAEKY